MFAAMNVRFGRLAYVRSRIQTERKREGERERERELVNTVMQHNDRPESQM